ncbi:MAG: 2-hydroxyacid dehydrogenase [Rhodospirillaceae bacterium]
MTLPIVLVCHRPGDEARAALLDELSAVADVRFLAELAPSERDGVLRRARAAMTYHPLRDLGDDGLAALDSCELIQCMTAGIDYLPLRDLPAGIPVAYNAGAYAEPMAEHVLAMAMAAAKRLRIEHLEMRGGAFNQFVPTRKFQGSTCGILGYGETGRAVGRLMRALGVRVQAINRSGKTDDPVDFVGTLDDVERVLETSDTVAITLSLTARTERLIGADRLRRMKPDAVLVNVARGEIVDEDALYAHLRASPRFTACLDAWWIEPVRHGRFETAHPFLDLPNVIASPHNSAMTDGALSTAARRAARNVRRLLAGEGPRFVAGEDEKLN